MSSALQCPRCGDVYETKKKLDQHVQRHVAQLQRAETKARVNEFLMQLAIKVLGEHEKESQGEGLSRDELLARVMQDPSYKEEMKKNPLVWKLGEGGRYLTNKVAKEHFQYDYDQDWYILRKEDSAKPRRMRGGRGRGSGPGRGHGSGAGRGSGGPGRGYRKPNVDGIPESPTSPLISLSASSSSISSSVVSNVISSDNSIVSTTVSTTVSSVSGVSEPEKKAIFEQLGQSGPSEEEKEEIDEEEKRQRTKDYYYALALSQIIYNNHNGNKNGAIGFYADRQSQRSSIPLERSRSISSGEESDAEDGKLPDIKEEVGPMFCYQLERGAYNGHNIAAIAVNLITGKIIGCEFNHCILLKSTTAHAEERLIDYLFKTAETCGLEPTVKYSEFLRDVAIYTSLEPCYQCAGKMIMAGVKRCIWLQNDPLIRVKIMKEISKNDPDFYIFTAAANEVCPQFKYSHQLEQEYLHWKDNGSKYFFLGPDETSKSNTVPTWLCTDSALDVYREASKEFKKVIGDRKNKDGPPTKVPVFGRSLTSNQTSLFNKQKPEDLDELIEHLRKAALHYRPENYNRGAHHT